MILESSFCCSFAKTSQHQDFFYAQNLVQKIELSHIFIFLNLNIPFSNDTFLL